MIICAPDGEVDAAAALLGRVIGPKDRHDAARRHRMRAPQGRTRAVDFDDKGGAADGDQRPFVEPDIHDGTHK